MQQFSIYPIFRIGAFILATTSLVSSLAHASFEFTPITASLAPSGLKAIGSFTVQNTSNSKVPVQIYIVPREPDINGKEVYKEAAEADDQFQIYPSQVILNPNEKRTVRISWVGSPSIKQELAFRMISEELPFDVDDPNKSVGKVVANVRIASKYVGSLYVTPLGAQSNLIARALPTQEGTPRLSLELENKGSAHQVLKGAKLKIAVAGKKDGIEIPADQLNILSNQNVLAGKTRRFLIPWPKNLPVGPVKVSLEVPKE